MAKATQRRRLGVTGILGKHDKMPFWQKDFLDGRVVLFLPGPNTTQGASAGRHPPPPPPATAPHFCCEVGWLTFRLGQDGQEPKAIESGLACCSGISSPHSPALLKPARGEGKVSEEPIQAPKLRLVFSYITLVHCIAGSNMLTKKSSLLCQLCLKLWFPNSADQQNYCEVGVGWWLCKILFSTFPHPHLLNQAITPLGQGRGETHRCQSGAKTALSCWWWAVREAPFPRNFRSDLLLSELRRNSAALTVLLCLTLRKWLFQ